MNISIEESREIAIFTAKVMDEKFAKDVMAIDISSISPHFDCFIIASGQSYTQLRALANYVNEAMEEKGLMRVNAKPTTGENPWILMDYSSIVVHIFLEETRKFYNLEKLWHDGWVLFDNSHASSTSSDT